MYVGFSDESKERYGSQILFYFTRKHTSLVLIRTWKVGTKESHNTEMLI